MGSTAVLLGAGTSIDAGLPSAFQMTNTVLQKLRESNDKTHFTLFGYVVSKIISRNVLRGGSPFDPVNIEEAYEALMSLIQRDSNVVSEFVYSWDPILSSLKSPFDERKFASEMSLAFTNKRRGWEGASTIDRFALGAAAHEISKAFLSQGILQEPVLTRNFLAILVSILSTTTNEGTYLDPLTRYISENSKSIVASLNYDLLLEKSFARIGLEYDVGLEMWNSKGIVSWRRDRPRFFKLHGSISWAGNPNCIDVSDTPAKFGIGSTMFPLLIFGGQSVKLTPNGPFLQLRHHFESDLMRKNKLLIVGYSFGDDHVNSILRRWVATRKRATMVIVDPGSINFSSEVFSNSVVSERGKLKKVVSLSHVKRSAATGLADALDLLERPFDPSVGQSSGMLPHILVTTLV